MDNNNTTELERLIAEQAKDMRSNRSYARWVKGDNTFEVPFPNDFIDTMNDNGLVYDSYHGWARDDII